MKISMFLLQTAMLYEKNEFLHVINISRITVFYETLIYIINISL